LRFRDLGIPEPCQLLGLLYSAPSERLVAHVQFHQGPFQIGRLYSRRPADSTYSSLVEVEASHSIETPVVCPLTPSLYFILNLLQRFEGPRFVYPDGDLSKTPATVHGDFAASWPCGVLRKRLDTGEVEGVVEYARPKEAESWIASLLGVSADGRELYCRRAVVASHKSVQYHLARLDLRAGTLTEITALPAIVV